MERYAAYKDSGIEWIGEIPEGWEVKRLKYLVSINDESLPETTEDNLQIKYVDISSVKSGTGILSTEKLAFSEAPSRARRIVRDGDIIVSTVRTYLKSIAKIDNPPENLIVSTGFAVIRPRIMTPDYIGYVFYSDNLIGEIISRSTGVSNPAINASEIGDIFTPIPNTEEQTAIANYLDRKTAEIDALIAQKERLITLYEEEKTAIINQAVTQGINPNAKLKDSGIDWLGKIPEGWDVLPLRRLTVFVKTGGTPSDAEEHHFEDDGYSWYSPGDFSEAVYLGLSKRSLSAAGKEYVYIFPKMTVMMVGIGATIGKVALAEMESSCNQRINAIGCNDKINPIFAAYYLKTMRDFIVRCGKFTTMPIINQDETKNLMVTVPSLEEQTAIVDRIETETTRIDAKIAKTQRIIELQKEYRTALISEVVTGKIKVPNTAA
jgi:type I restriction enzyme, S subunit